MINPIVKTIELGDGRTITLETGKLAKQADGAVMKIIVTYLPMCHVRIFFPTLDDLALRTIS